MHELCCIPIKHKMPWGLGILLGHFPDWNGHMATSYIHVVTNLEFGIWKSKMPLPRQRMKYMCKC